MHRSPPETSDNSRRNEATPLLQSEAFEYDDTLYAIGGAVGGSAEVGGAVGDSTEIGDELLGLMTAINDAMEQSEEGIFGDSGTSDEDIYVAQVGIDGAIGDSAEVGGAVVGSTEIDDALLSLMTAISDAMGESAEGIDGASGSADESICEVQVDIDDSEELGRAVVGSTEIDDALLNLMTAITNAMGESAEGIDVASGSVGEAACEDQADIDDIVIALFKAWLEFPPRKSSEPGSNDLEFFVPKAREAMSKIWRQIKAERDVLPEPEMIVHRLSEYIVHYIFPRNLKVPELQFFQPESAVEYVKEAFSARITAFVADGWHQILDGIKKENKERARRKREKRRRIRQRMRRNQEIEEVYRFYAPFTRMNYRIPFNRRTFCLFLCHCCSVFMFQIPIHTLLLGWPVSIGVMGVLYMTQCPMSYFMPYVMMTLGAVGTVALLMRLSFVIYEKIIDYEMSSKWPWRVLKFIEFIFLDLLMVQWWYFFSKTPSFVPGSPKYCNKTFYGFVHWANYVSIALVSAWIFVYFTKGLAWYLNRKFDYGYR